jgi:glycosyltransferase involved in cell wall biosynthesis
VQSGAYVEWFSSSFPGAQSEEAVDGINIVRRGSQWNVHARAIQHYRGRLRGAFDVVFDEINTIPFFTPVWADIPHFVLIWQLAREVWWYESPFPINAGGFLVEPLYLRLYRHTPVITFSRSTRSDLDRLGFRGRITVVPPGIEPIAEFNGPKRAEPTFIYVGRLAPSKRVHEIVEAFAIFRHDQHRGRLQLIGSGPTSYTDALDRLAARLGVKDWYVQCGWLQGDAKHTVMAESHALLMASVREGWGLVVTECNACGTPAVVYDVPGLRDSVRHLETGIVVPPSPAKLAEGMARLLADQNMYQRMCESGRQWSKTFTYDAGFQLIRDVIASATVTVDQA